MDKEMKYRASINPTLTEFHEDNIEITNQLMILYAKMLFDNKLNPKECKPVIMSAFVGSDFEQNKITVVLECSPILIYGVDEVYRIKNYNT
jgi:hypothetical protein